VLAPASYVSYNLLALLCCAALLPLTLTAPSQPETPSAPRLRPGLAWTLSPLAVGGRDRGGRVGGVLPHGRPALRHAGGAGPDQIGLFLAAFVLGGALAQWPAGWLADRFDRRTC
jgi:MFS family permease